MSLVATGLGWTVTRLLYAAFTNRELPWLKITGALALALLALEAFGATTNRDYRATGTTIEGETYLNRDDVFYLEPLRED
jgi:hypothetical protein